MRVYNALVAEHFAHPHNTPCHAPAANVRYGQAGSIDAGVVVRLSARYAQHRLLDVRFEAYACPYVIAAASLLTQKLQGAALDEAARWSWRAFAPALDLPQDRRGRLLVLEDALRNLLKSCSS